MSMLPSEYNYFKQLEVLQACVVLSQADPAALALHMSIAYVPAAPFLAQLSANGLRGQQKGPRS